MATPVAMVGNEFLLPQPKIKAPEPKAEMKVEASIPAVTISPQEGLTDKKSGIIENTPNHGRLHIFHQHTFIIVSVSLLIIGAAAIKVGGNYWAAKYIPVSTASTIKTGIKPVSGFNMTIPAADFQAKLASITGQPATLTAGTLSEPLGSDMVKSWLQISSNKSKSEYYLHVNEAAISNSITKEASTYAKAPVNQVTVNEDGVSRAVVGGRDGRALSDPNGLKTQAHEVAKNVLSGKGVQFNTPLTSVPFQSVGPGAFPKVLVADITTKKMWAYENGNQVNSWLVSAGKPSTPTPVGQFKIYAKYSSQDMRGTNPDGSPYFQPAVPWVNYFYSGSAVHGVYWHPLSWFGNINSSHGCIGLPVDEAHWVFNWAPIGTTVIVHT